MKLKSAPVIVAQLGAELPWIKAAAKETRKRFADPPTHNQQNVPQQDCSLKQLAEDIWAIDGPLEIHTDKTRKGFRVIGLVLINEPGLVLVSGQRTYALPVGTIYHIDGRAPHGALCRIDGPDFGVFGFMAWDVHRDEDLNELVDSIPDAMQAFADGEPRIDVSTIAKPVSELEHRP